MDFELDRASFDEIRDSVDHGIFYERLQQEWWDENVERVLIDIFFHLDARAKAHFFNREKRANQRQLLLKRNRGFLTEAKRAAQKITEEDAHFAGLSRIGAGERADGIEAVEEKVWIHLGFQSPQLRVASENSRLHFALFRFLRLLYRQQDVEESDCEQVEQDSGTEEKGEILRKVRFNPIECRETGEFVSQSFRGQNPESADHDRAEQVRERQLKRAGAVERRPAAGIPCGEAHEPVEKAERNAECKGFHPSESAGNREQIYEHSGERKPGEQVRDEPPEVAENGMHC